MTELHVPEKGPYMNDDGDWWVPVECASFREARAAIVGCLDYNVPEDGTLVYRGKERVFLDSRHEAGCDASCPSRRRLLAFRFQENRLW